MTMILSAALIILGNWGWSAEKPISHKPKSVSVKISFKNDDGFPLKMKVYEVKKASQYDISETRIVSSMKKVPADQLLVQPFSMQPAGNRSMILVLENNTKSSVFFLASPHVVHPGHASFGHEFECLCNHMVYEVPPGQFWYRIVRLNLSPDFQDTEMDVVHDLIGVSKEDAHTKYRDILYNGL